MNFENKYRKYKKKYFQALSNLNPIFNDNLEKIIKLNKNNCESILCKFFEHQIQIKMLHFQTKKYGFHKTLDEYLSKFNSLFDKFMEVCQGVIEGRLNNTNININVSMVTDENIIYYIDSFIKVVLIDMIENFTDNKGLISIRDEMIAEAEQLKYLLSFN